MPVQFRTSRTRHLSLAAAAAVFLTGCAPTATGDGAVGMTALGTTAGFNASAISRQAYSAEPETSAEHSTTLATRTTKPPTLLDAMRQAKARDLAREERRTTSIETQRTTRVTTRVAALQPAAPARTEIAAKSRKRLGELPGVRKLETMGGVKTLKRIKRAVEKPVRVAAAATLGRIGGNGLHVQHRGVQVNCLPRRLVATIKRAEKHFGRSAVVTSGFRSRTHNRRVGGAKNSMHTRCLAADVQMRGVTKWQLATYFRSQPGRGGVGTYCHTASVHVDVGPQRDWNWRCRRRKR